MSRVLLISLHDPFAIGIRQLSAYIKQYGHSTHLCYINEFDTAYTHAQLSSEAKLRAILDSSSKGITEENDLRLGGFEHGKIYEPRFRLEPLSAGTLHNAQAVANSFSPDIIGIGCRTWVRPLIAKLIAALRQVCPHSHYICGGMGPTTEPESFLDLGFDAVVRGEGEGALLDICSCVDGSQDFTRVPNLAYKTAGTFVANPLRPLIEDIDSLPMPDLSLNNATYLSGEEMRSTQDWVATRNEPYSVLSSRGCIGRCSYCATHAWEAMYKSGGLKTRQYRLKALGAFLDEITVAKKLGAKFIRIADEYFIRKTDELINFFANYNASIATPYTAYLNPTQLISSDALFLQATKHLFNFTIGLQSASDSFNREIYNRFQSVQDSLKVVKKMCSVYIPSTIQFITGQPLETEEDFNHSLDYVRSLPRFSCKTANFISIQCSFFYPSPQSPIVMKFPDLLTKPYSQHEWLYYSTLLSFRWICGTDEEFQETVLRTDFKKDPVRFVNFYNAYRADSLKKDMENAAVCLEGKEVLFFGMGATYHRWKHLFTSVSPAAMIVDDTYLSQQPLSEIDGIPVVSLSSMREAMRDLPLVIFAKGQFIPTILRRLWQIDPAVADAAVVCAPAGAQID